MKKLILFTLFPLLTFAQKDTVKVLFSEEKVETFEKTTLLDEYDKAFGGNRIVKSALRFGTQTALNGGFIPSLQFERKIATDKSIIAIIGGVGERYSTNFNIGLESRWYYKMKERVNKGTLNANITGEYISFKGLFNPTFRSSEYGELTSIYQLSGPIMFRVASTFSLNWGRQFGNNVDFGVSLGVKNGKESYISSKGGWINDNRSPSQSTWFLSTNSRVGFGLYFPRKKQISTNYCEFLRCNYEVNHLFKANINNAFYLDRYNQKLKIDVAYERKIGRSPFSLNSNLIITLNNTYQFKQIGSRDSVYQFSNRNYTISTPIFSSTKKNFFDYSFEINEQLRYYLGMQKRIAKGKSANNLTGLYTGVQAAYKIGQSQDLFYINNSFNLNNTNNRNTSFIGVILGYQVQTNRKSYLDIGTVFGTKLTKSHFKNLNIDSQLRETYLEFNLKLGFAK